MTRTRWVKLVSAALLVTAASAALVEDHAARAPARNPEPASPPVNAYLMPGRGAAAQMPPTHRPIFQQIPVPRPYPGGSPPVGMRAPHDWRTP
jgi:hypothetical protein